MENTDVDPYLNSRSSGSCTANITMKTEIKSEPEDFAGDYSNSCIIELNEGGTQNKIKLNSSDVVFNSKTGCFVCVHCLMEIKNNMLSDHMVSTHNYRRILFKCRNCEEKFHDRNKLTLHRKDCNKPQAKKRKKRTFQQILKEVERETIKISNSKLENSLCPICSLELPKYKLKQHVLNEHKDTQAQTVNCKKCNKNFKSKWTLREHVRMVHESVEDSVECELCGQKFCSVKYLNNHKRNVHPTGGKIHKCDICSKVFKSHLCLHQHLKSVHPPKSASVACPHCHKSFKTKISLRQHLKVSHGIRKKT